VVDDDVEILALLAAQLLAEGHAVDTAPDGQTALECLARGPYDMIVADIRMPVLDGPGLYRRLAQRGDGLERTMVFITGDTFEPSTQAFLETARRPYLAKPFRLEDVRTLIEQS
jgi:CheY-like chemotaxis protein